MNEPLTPLVTTIIPTYRRPQLLKRAIKSVLQQTYPNIQVCIYDNASGDETASVVAEIAKIDSRIKYYCHTENIGAGNNFLYGLEHVNTPFFSFLSDDDILLPTFYEIALNGFNNHPDAMFSATDVLHLYSGRVMKKTPLRKWTSGFYKPPHGLAAILENGYSEWTGILFKREVTEKIGFIDQEVGSASDLDFILRIASHCPFVVTKHLGAVFDDSVSQVRSLSDTAWLGWLKMIHHITEDKSIPIDIRDYAEGSLISIFKKNLSITGMGYICRGNIVDSEKAVALHRDIFGESAITRILSVLIFIYKHLPFTRFVFKLLVVYRKYILTGISQNHFSNPSIDSLA